MRMNIFWPYRRQFLPKREGLKALTLMEKSLSGKNREIEECCLDRKLRISYFIATALTWR